MNKTMSNIFDKACANEIEKLVDRNAVPDIPFDILSSIKNKVYVKTGVTPPKKRKSLIFKWKYYVATAACLCLIINAIIFVPILKKDDPNIIPNPDNNSINDIQTTKTPLPLFSPNTFYSFEDFEKHEKDAGEKAVKYYYKPSVLTQDYEFSQITKRDDIYVMIEYTLSSNRNVSDEKLSDYDAQRMSTLLCQTSLYPDGKKTLEESFINNGFEEIEYKGKVYYRMDEHADNDPNKQITAYEILFLIDNDLIFMHFPAIDTFENMMKFAQVTKVVID